MTTPTEPPLVIEREPEDLLSELNLNDKESLCDVCKVLDLNEVFFGEEDYQFPHTKANALKRWRNAFCTFVFYLRKQKSCPLCHLIITTLRQNERFDALEDGIVVAQRIRLHSKETEMSIPNFYFLDLSVSEGGDLSETKDYGWAIGVQGTHELFVRNSRDACLQHFYPHLLPGMVPLTTTYEQMAQFDKWRRETGSHYTTQVRKIDTAHISIELLKRWLGTCEEDHIEWCRDKLPPHTDNLKLRLLDVTTGNIVRAPINCRYLALSYVWGQVHASDVYLRLELANCGDLGQPGALFHRLQLLPNTIKDAMTLCQNLGERYLWIDSLCIVQDSPEDKQQQISKMDEIYRRAVLTIVAAAGSTATAGLPGVRPDFPRKGAPTGRIQNINLLSFPQYGEVEANTSTWNSRAWTFQERLLSKRLLIFTESSITFNCQEACWREDFELQGPKADHFRLTVKDREKQELWQVFHQVIDDDLVFENMVPKALYVNVFQSLFKRCFAALMEDFTRRNLTYDGDILNAFHGIQSALSKSMGPFHMGLPQGMLAQALTWQSVNPGATVRPGFPSWCWAGWIFGQNNRASYLDQILGPFPGFSIFNDESKMVHWDDGLLKDPYIGIYEWNDALLYPVDDDDGKEMDKILSSTIWKTWNREPEIPLSNFLFFWSSTVPVKTASQSLVSELEFSDDMSEDEDYMNYYEEELLEGLTVIRKYNLGEKDEGILTNGHITTSEARGIMTLSNSSELDFVYLGSSSCQIGSFALILICWDNGVARRVFPHLLFMMIPENWEAAEPKRKLVVLV